jgi:poly(3-hydroxybutyrate) depolymerase
VTLLQSKLRINSKQIYATGKSQGGGFVGVLACDSSASKIFAAFAPVSGAFYTTVAASQCNPDTVAITCSPGRSMIPFIEFHGGADDTILYAGDTRRGVCLPSIPHYITAWAVRNGLSSANSSAPYATDTTEYSFGNGEVRGYFDKVIGHDWPSTLKNSDNDRAGHAPASYNASEIIVEFFKKYTLP